jgi:hypothetical protein
MLDGKENFVKHWWWLTLFLLVSTVVAQVPVEILKVEPHSHTRCALADMASDEKDPWGSCLVVWYKNVSEKQITGIRFDVHFVSALKEVDPAVYPYENTATVKPGKEIAGIWHDGVFWHQYGDGMDAQVQVARVMFRDGSFWNPPSPSADTNPPNAPAPAKPLDRATARDILVKTINASFTKDGVAGYAEISGDKMTVHSERASTVRFNMTLKNEKFISTLKDAGIATYVYTNDADQSFLYDVNAAQAISPPQTDAKPK